tara:strand:+ start:1171 stop:2031 length:861 start_codon:yes stop_codon:yes gene_type:complete
MHISLKIVMLYLIVLISRGEATELVYFDVYWPSSNDEINVLLDREILSSESQSVLDIGLGKTTFLLEDNSLVESVSSNCKDESIYIECVFKLKQELKSIPVIGILGESHRIKSEKFEWQKTEILKRDTDLFGETLSCEKFTSNKGFSFLRCLVIDSDEHKQFLSKFYSKSIFVTAALFNGNDLDPVDSALYRYLTIDGMEYLLKFEYLVGGSIGTRFSVIDKESHQRVFKKLKPYGGSSLQERRAMLTKINSISIERGSSLDQPLYKKEVEDSGVGYIWIKMMDFF